MSAGRAHRFACLPALVSRLSSSSGQVCAEVMLLHVWQQSPSSASSFRSCCAMVVPPASGSPVNQITTPFIRCPPARCHRWLPPALASGSLIAQTSRQRRRAVVSAPPTAADTARDDTYRAIRKLGIGLPGPTEQGRYGAVTHRVRLRDVANTGPTWQTFTAVRVRGTVDAHTGEDSAMLFGFATSPPSRSCGQRPFM